MLKTFLTCLLTLPLGAVPPSVEPPGVHLSGRIAPFQAEPAPPAWLRLESHALADPDCRHYGYEVYAGEAHWLVRYVMFPEDREEFREIEQVFLYPRGKAKAKPERIPSGDLQVEPLAVRWNGQTLPLVDRRDLLRD